ncbi:MAG: sensor histidine kinase [Rhodoglobus sp.]
MLSQSAAIFGTAVFSAETIPWFLGQMDEAYPLWSWTVISLLSGSLLFVLLLSLAQWWVRPAHAFFALIYLLSLLSWPFGVLPDAQVFEGIHWLKYVLTIAVAMATISFTTPLACVYLAVASLTYYTIRMIPQGGGASWQVAAVETIYEIILGTAVIIIVTMLRQASSVVDSAQSTALDRYGIAVRQHAMEVERVRVDAIVHDSVLMTLISATRADTAQERALAATMAGNAIDHLQDAATANPDDGAMMSMTELASRVTETAQGFPSSFTVRMSSLGSRSVSVGVGDELHCAAMQAMVNSIQHAGGSEVFRWVAINALMPDGIEIVIGDAGSGFSLSTVPEERLGVRISILERVAHSGGLATVASRPQHGTVVTIRWPRAIDMGVVTGAPTGQRSRASNDGSSCELPHDGVAGAL